MTTRVTGIASGLDTDSIISVLVAAKKVPITDLKSQVVDEQEILDAYNKVETLSNTLEDAANTLTLSSTWNGRMVTSSDDTVATATAVDSTATGIYKLVVSTLASAEIVRAKPDTTTTSFTGTFTLNGAEITVDGGDLEDVADAINDAVDAGSMTSGSGNVRAYVLNGSLVIENETLGTDAVMEFSEDSGGTLLSSLNISDDYGATYKNDYAHDDGTDLTGTINGVAITSTSNTITDISGVTITVNDTTDSTGIRLTVGTDTTGIKESIQDFLDAYNEVYTYLEKSTAVSTTSDGEAVSSGVLQGENYASSLQTQLFQFMGKYLTNSELEDYRSLYSLGITRDDDTGEYSITDEDALTGALTSNFDDVMNIFTGGDASGYYGIAKTMDTFLSDKVLNKLDGSLESVIGETETQISNKEDRIDILEDRLLTYETSLYAHYAAMENMVQSWNSQLQYLLSNLGISSDS